MQVTLETYTYKPTPEEVENIRAFKPLDEEEEQTEGLHFIHKHPRDDNIIKDDASHTYTIDEQVYTSVTTIKSKFMPSFDPLKTFDFMFKHKTDKYTSTLKVNGAAPDPNYTPRPNTFQAKNKSDYHNMTAKEIATAWSDTALAGTKVHRALELLFNKYYKSMHHMSVLEIEYHLHALIKDNEMSPDTVYLLAPVIKHLHANNWKIYRTEWAIYDEEYAVAGTIDAVFYKDTPSMPENKTFMIVDWKTKSKYKKIKDGSANCYYPLRQHRACNLTEYLFQLSTYAHILRNKYGIQANTLAAVVIAKDGVGVEYLPVLNMKNALDIYKSYTQITTDITQWMKSNQIKDFPIVKEPVFVSNTTCSEYDLIHGKNDLEQDDEFFGASSSSSLF